MAKTTVWCCVVDIPYEPGWLEGVYSTLEKALAAKGRSEVWSNYITIYSRLIDEDVEGSQ